MFLQRLSFQVDNAFSGTAILRQPLCNTAAVGFGRVLARRRRRQIRVCDLFCHSHICEVKLTDESKLQRACLPRYRSSWCYIDRRRIVSEAKPELSGCTTYSKPLFFRTIVKDVSITRDFTRELKGVGKLLAPRYLHNFINSPAPKSCFTNPAEIDRYRVLNAPYMQHT